MNKSSSSERLALMIDVERCIGCKSCEAACKAEHGLGPGEYRNRVVWLGDTTRSALDFLTLSCQHCERPACLRACPVNPKAINKDPLSGVVAVNESQCTGCGECIVACPYGAMGYHAEQHHAVKCDLCSDRRAAGKRTACATVCPAEAIQYGRREDHLAKLSADGRSALDHDAFLLGPANIYLDRIGAASLGQDRSGTELSLPERHRPRVVDDAQQRKKIQPGAISFPFRSEREARQPDTTVPGGCNICFNCCPTEYHLKNGKLVRVTGNENDPQWRGRVCPKSQFLLQLYNSEKRLTQPLKRVGRRGEGHFEPISWQQALDEIAAKLTSIRDTHGSESLGIFAGTRTGTLTRLGYIRMFSQLWGTPNLTDTEAFCSASKDKAFKITQGVSGSGNSYTAADLGSAALYVYVGDNQAESRPVHFGMINNWRLDNQAKMVVVDPRLTVTASKADEWLPIRNGTDLALGLALIHSVFSQQLHDQTYCDTWVAGWQQWRAFIFAQQYTPEWAAELTGISAEQINSLATQIATVDGCVIFAGRGINQHSNGTQTNRVFFFLAAITGNYGRRGGTYWNYGTPTNVQADAPVSRHAPLARPSLGDNPTTWIDAVLGADPYPLKAIITNNNPLSAWPNQDRVREAFLALDLLVHIELFANDTSAYADYVLPAATGIEKGEIGRASEDRRIIWIDRMIEPPGDAKPDGWIWIELGKRFGFDDVLKEEYKDSAVFWDAECIKHPGMRGVTQRRLHAAPARWVRAPIYEEGGEQTETLYLEGTTAHACPEGHRFPTVSGKLEFWTAELEQQFAAIGLSPLPAFYSDPEQLVDMPYLTAREESVVSPFQNHQAQQAVVDIVHASTESPARSLRQRGFDTQLLTGRPPAPHFHSWTHYAWQAQEMWPDLYVQMHPDKAAATGVTDGDEVCIETSYGQMTARAWIHAGIRQDSIFIPIGWDASQPFHPWHSVNYLTDSSQRDPISAHSNLKTYLCRISIKSKP